MPETTSLPVSTPTVLSATVGAKCATAPSPPAYAATQRPSPSSPLAVLLDMASDGALYRGTNAWLTVLWALRGYRGWALQLSRDGEILVRSAYLFDGYFDDEAATTAALRDGWFHTGDRGALDFSGGTSTAPPRRCCPRKYLS